LTSQHKLTGRRWIPAAAKTGAAALAALGARAARAQEAAPAAATLNLSPLARGWISFGIWLAGALVASKVVHWVWDHALLPIARRTKTTLDVGILEATRGPMRWVTFLALTEMGAKMSFRGLPPVTDHPAWGLFQGALYIALVLGITGLAYGVAHAVMDWYSHDVAARTKAHVDSQFLVLFRKLAKFVFFFIAATVVFDHFGVQITGLLATAGVMSLAVAFAAQETIANMIAGFVLMIDRPFKPGDRIQFGSGQTGDVLDIGLRSTRVLSFDHTVITVPNAEIAKAQIVNFSAPDPQFKIRAPLGVAYGTDLRKAKAVLLDVLNAHPEVRREPAPPAVFFTGFGESALELMLVYWVNDYHDQFRIRDEVNMAIKDRFEAEGIEVPFPQRSLHIRSAVELPLAREARRPSADSEPAGGSQA